MTSNLESLLPQIIHIARAAGEAILAVYAQDDVGIRTKADATPVTKADFAANQVIADRLAELSQYPVLSEESEHKPWQERQNWQRYWLVDPLDGTREFIKRNGEFSVNIALIEGNYPLFGVFHLPFFRTTYWGGAGLGAWKQENGAEAMAITTRTFQPEKEVVALSSRSHITEATAHYLEALQAVYPNMTLKKVGSSLKSCLVAEGLADIYPRLGPTCEWDTGAVQAIVEGAGGVLLMPDGQRFTYNAKESLVNGDFIVLGDPSIGWSEFWPPGR